MLVTARLCLRRLTVADAPAVAAYRRDPQIALYLGWGVVDPGALERDLREMQARAPLEVAGPWFQLGVEHAGALIGDVGVRALADEPSAIEIGYTIAPAWQRRGFATEAVRALCDWILAGHGRHRVLATADHRNAASIAVAERAGLVPVSRVESKHAGVATTFVTYERRR